MTKETIQKKTPDPTARLLPLFAFWCLFNMGTNFAHPVTPTYIIERGLDSSMFGMAYAAAMFTMFLVAPFWGQLCNYLPTRSIALISCLGYGLGQFFFLMAYSNAAMIAARLFAGCFTSGAFVAVSNYIVNTAAGAKDRGRNLTVYATIQGVAGAVGYFAAGMLGVIRTEIPLTCQIFILSGSGIGMYFLMVDDTAYKQVPDKKLSLRDVNPLAAFLKAGEFMNATLLLLFLATGFSVLGQVCLEQVFQYYLKAHFGLPSSYNGTIKAVLAISGLAVNSLVTMRLMKSKHLEKVLLPVLLGMTVPMCMIFVFHSFYPLVICYLLVNLVYTVRSPLLQNLTANSGTPRTSNLLMGMYQSIGYIGSCLGGLFSGSLYNVNELLPFYVAAVMLAVSCICAWLYGRRAGKQLL